MRKGKIMALMLSIVGGLSLSIGISMTLIDEWNVMIPGIVLGVIGGIILLLIWPLYRKIVAI